MSAVSSMRRSASAARKSIPAARRLHSGGAEDTLIDIPIEEELPKRAQVVIAGSGLIGNSLAYHLVSNNAWRDVVIVDRGNIADGTSKYGSGMLGMFRPTHERKIVQYSMELYRMLQKRGFDIGLKQCGSLNLANSKDRMISLRRRANRYMPTGLECYVLSPQECKEKHPLLHVTDLEGGVWVPGDANVHPKKVSESLAYLAYDLGARFVGGCGVQRVLTRSSNELGPHTSHNVRVAAVETDKGTIECDYFVNCAGIWARHLGKLCDPVVKVPVCAAEHFFLTFKPLGILAEGLDIDNLPNVRDYDNHIYFRGWNNSLLMGAFEKEARPFHIEKENKWNELNESHWIHMSPYISAANRRMPILKEITFDFLLNTPDAFTPDGRWIMGEAPEVGNYYVAAGMNGNSLQAAGGVGKVVADWIMEGHPPGNMLHFEVQRFTNLHNNARYLRERVTEAVGRQYSLQYPIVNEFVRGRRIRTSPIFSELESRGAVFGERMGWERPLYFEPYHSREDPPAKLPKGTFGKPSFFDQIEEEYLACRDAVGVIDMSSFAKFNIKGEEDTVVRYLQHLCAKDINCTVGKITPTGMLNEKGGYENDCLLIRKGPGSFFMVSPTQQQTRILEWMENHLPADNSVSLEDVTSMYTVLSVVGPKGKDLIQELSHTNMEMSPFTYKYVNMGYASGVIVCATTQTGEPGYSLYVPTDHALHLYDKLMTVGQDYGIRNVGQLAMRFLRIERFNPFWGEEMTAETTPIECGRSFKFKDVPFIGMSALEKQRDEGVTKRLACFILSNFDKDVDAWPWCGEAIYRNGEFVGHVTNSAYGFSIHKMICLGFIEHPDSVKDDDEKLILDSDWIHDSSAKWTIDIAGRRIPAQMSLRAPTMPKSGKDEAPKNKPGHAPQVDILQKKQPKEKKKK